MKLKLKRGTTSKLLKIFVQDSSVTTGAGLTGLTNASGSLTWYYIREGDAAATSVSIVSATVGTYTSGGFKEVSSANMPGVYEIGIPDAALSTGNSVVMVLKGAANMAPVAIEIELDAVDYQDAVAYGLSRIDAAVTTRLAPTVAARTLDVSAGGEAGLDWSNIGSPTTSVNLSGTTTGTVSTATTVSSLAADSVNASALAADAVTEIQSGLATSANQTTILNRIGAFTGSGLNTILGFLKAVMSKAAALTPSDVGGTFDNTTDSQEALRDRGDAAWTTATGFATAANYDATRAARLDNLDATISSRLASAGYTAPDNTSVTAIKAKTDNLPASPAAVGSAMTLATDAVNAAALAADAVTEIQAGLGTASAQTAIASDVSAVKAKTDNLPVSPAAVGSAMTLAADSVSAAALATDAVTEIVTGLLDLANGVETGRTVRQVLRLLAAAEGGKVSGAAGSTIHIRDLGDTKDRVLATVDLDGNRTAVTLDLT